MKKTRKNSHRFTLAIIAVITVSFAILSNCDNGVSLNNIVTNDGGTPASKPDDDVSDIPEIYAVTIPGINGVTAPVFGAIPVSTIIENEQLSGTVTWSPDVSGTFAANTVYTATIILTAKPGYTFEGVQISSDYFTVAGATSVNSAAYSGVVVVTAIFPATGSLAIDPIEAQIYTGSEITPKVTVKEGAMMLTLNADYTVSYNDNINVGTATVTVIGVGNYAGDSGSTSFAINPKVITFDIDPISEQTYTGSEITPVITIKDDLKTLTLDTDYSVSYSNNINVDDNALVTVIGIGNYEGSAGSAIFKINPKVIDFDIDSIAAQIYTGNPITPTVTVKDGSTTLSKDIDYTVAYSNNINTGTNTATVTVSGIGNYAGSSGSKLFSISSKSTTFDIDPIAAQTYNGSPITPAVTVKDGGKTLTLGADYTVLYSDNTNAGTNAMVTVTGIGNHEGIKTIYFTINPKVINFTIDSIAAQTYTGSAFTPTVTVKDSSTILTLNTHYTVSYSNNTNTGTATVNISGAGNYAGSTGSATFTINPKVITFDIDSIAAQTYNGSPITPAVTVKDGDKTLTLGTDYTVSYSGNINTGTNTAKVTVTGAGNYAGSTGSATFTINPKTVTFDIDSIAAQTYTGNPITPAVTVKDGDKTLALGTDYTVSYSNNTNVGTYATVNVTGIGNYAGNSGNKNFTINKATPTISAWPTAAAITYGAALSTSTLSGGTSSTTGTFAWASGTTVPPIGTNSYGVIFTPNDTGNYNTVTGDVSITVNAPYEYIIMGSGTSFTATRGGAIVGTANQTISTVIGYIKTDANRNAVKIQFGDGTNTLDIGTAYALFNNNTTGGTWGAITLTGKITSNVSSATDGTVIVAAISVSSMADITNTSENNTANTVYNSSGTFNISGGTISATTGRAVYNYTSSTLNISGGTISATTGRAVYNYSSSTVNISGGTISATTGTAVYNDSGTVNISGGTVSTTTGITVYDNYNSKGINISGSGKVTSANVNATEGTIYLVSNPNPLATSVRLEISGGTVSNTALSGGRAVYNNYAGQINILGGTVQAAGIGGYAIMNTNENSNLYLSMLYSYYGLTITGLIRPSAAGKLSVGSYFGNGPYVLDYASYNNGDVAVVRGASYLSSFMLYNQPNLQLKVYGDDLVISVVSNSSDYVISGSGSSFTATKSGATIGTGAIQTVIDSIRTHANGTAATIQFYNGSNALNIGTASAQFNGSWGAVTLKGRITSNVSSTSSGTVYIGDTVSVTSTAEIANTNETNTTSALYFNSTGTLTISGGSVSSTNGGAVRNASYGIVNISGGTVLTAGVGTGAVRNTSSGTVNISGGMVLENGNGQQDPSYAVHNSGDGKVNISGGTVSATYGTAVANASTTGAIGQVNISGGTVSSGNARAVVCSSGKIIVSGTALVTSANDVASPASYSYPGTIYVPGGELEIKGGTVENTANYQTARTVYFSSSSGTVTISGGTVRAQSGIAVYNASPASGKIIVSGTALVTSPNAQGTIYLASAQDNNTVQLEVTGGNIRNTGSSLYGNAYNNAIYNDGNGSITIEGGVVQSKTGRAVIGIGNDASSRTLNFLGGLLFSYYYSASIPAEGVTVKSNAAYTSLYGVYYYHGTSSTYTAGTTTDIDARHAIYGIYVTGVWAKNGSRSGINFSYNGSTVFVEVEDVTVN